mmetsp:Transcript_33289/g.55020  ORF Transcript_33289/g.55020 Transcript_33289/m.55020 type:complete len:245 (+) Transcript_33289:298-1032(+)
MINSTRVAPFVIFSEMRSGSSSLVRMLDALPQVQCGLELLNNNRLAQLDVPKWMAHYWANCSKLACGFKIFQEHIRRLEDVYLVPAHLKSVVAPVKTIVLERQNQTARWLSFRRALITADWSTGADGQTKPCSGALRLVSSSNASRLSDPPGCLNMTRERNMWRRRLLAMSFREFKQMSYNWFSTLRQRIRGPYLWLHTEDLHDNRDDSVRVIESFVLASAHHHAVVPMQWKDHPLHPVLPLTA